MPITFKTTETHRSRRHQRNRRSGTADEQIEFNLMAEKHSTRRNSLTSVRHLRLLLIGIILSFLISSTRAANPIQIGFRAATSRSPFLSRFTRSRPSLRSPPPSTQSRNSVIPISTSNDDDIDDSAVQSAFWHASSPVDVIQSRHIEFPVSRQSPSKTPNYEPQSELEFRIARIEQHRLLLPSLTFFL